MTSRPRRPSCALVAGALTAAILGVTPVGPADARSTTASHITGTLTGPDGSPLPGVAAKAYRRVVDAAGSSSFEVVGSTAWSDDQGRYDIAGLPPGTYRVGFHPHDFDLAAEYYADQPVVQAAQDIALSELSTVAGIDARLATSARLSGRVTDAAGTALDWVVVRGFVKAGDGWVLIRNAITDGRGQYLFENLPHGVYRVDFTDSTATGDVYEAWNDRGSFAEADDIPVASGIHLTGKDARLVAGEHDPAPVVSPTGPTAPAPTPTITFPRTMRVRGAPTVGSTLTLKNYRATVTHAVATYAFQWFAGRSKIRRATGTRLRITRALKGKKVSVRVTARAGRTVETVRIRAGTVR